MSNFRWLLGILAIGFLLGAGILGWLYREELTLIYVRNNTAKIMNGLMYARSMDLLEEDQQGLYLSHSRKQFVGLGQEFLFRKPLTFMWCVPPPCGSELRFSPEGSNEISGNGRPVFYACSLDVICRKRFFVFLGHLNRPQNYPYYGWFKDEDVSWYFQTRLSDLNEEDLLEEQEFRKKCNFQFPIDEKLPD